MSTRIAAAQPQPSESVALPFSCAVEAGKVRLTPGRERTYAVLGARSEQVVLACAGGDAGQSGSSGSSGSKSCRTMVAHRFDMSCGGRRVAWVDVAAAIGGRRFSRLWIEDGRFNLAIISAVAARGPCATASGAGEEGAAQGERPCVGMDPARAETHFKMPPGFAPLAHLGARIMPRALAVDTPEPQPESSTPGRAVAAASPAPTAGSVDRRTLERTIITEPLPDVVGSAGRDASRLRGAEEAEPRQQGARADGTEIARAPEETAGSRGAPPESPLARLGGGEGGAGERATAAEQGIAGSTGANGQPAPWATTILPPADAGMPASPIATGTNRAADAAGNGPAPVVTWLMLTLLIASGGWLAWLRQAQLQAVVQRLDAPALLASWLQGLVSAFASGAQAITRGAGALSGSVGALTRQFAGRWGVQEAAGPAGDMLDYPVTGLEGALDRVGHQVASLPANSALGRVLGEELGRVRQRLKVAEAAGRADAGTGAAAGAGSGPQPPRIPAAAYRVLMRELLRIERIAEGARESIAAVGGEADPGGRMPSSRSEALALLGINPNVDAATIKRVVDALRMSWHPDLAHDEADRVLREVRIKQINVAAELLLEQSRPG